MNHKNAKQFNDTMFCDDCNQCWDVNDLHPPECVSPLTSPLTIVEVAVRVAAVAAIIFILFFCCISISILKDFHEANH